MAKMSETDRAAFTEAYRFFERFHDMPDTVESWTECADQIAEIVPRYESNALIRNLLMACYDTMDAERSVFRKALA